jgi:hypothetical protein
MGRSQQRELTMWGPQPCRREFSYRREDTGAVAGRLYDRLWRLLSKQNVPTSFGQTIALDRGRVDLLPADEFAHLLPEVAIPSLPFVGAYGIRVKSLTLAA